MDDRELEIILALEGVVEAVDFARSENDFNLLF